MTVLPSITVIGLNAMLALVGAATLRKPWQQFFALGCAALELLAVIVLLIVVSVGS